MNKQELWLRLKDYRFDDIVPAHLWVTIQAHFSGVDASTKAFANKVSKKAGWTNRFALRSIWEYKKFVYLGVISNFKVTPSQVVDQVWHQHILFSKAYRFFCKEIIEYELDHTPELLPFDEQTKLFTSQYLNTLHLYEREFNRSPPSDIWSIPKFDPDLLGYENEVIKRKNYAEIGVGDFSNQWPLHFSFTNNEGNFDFGGGDGGGAGSGGSWDDAASDSSDSSSCSSSCSSCGSD